MEAPELTNKLSKSATEKDKEKRKSIYYLRCALKGIRVEVIRLIQKSH